MAICTVPICSHSVWCQEAIHNAGIESALIRWQGHTIHPTGMRQILIPRQSSGQHPTLPYQRHCIPLIQTNRGYDEANPSTSRLPSHAGRHRTLLPRKQNGIISTQQCKLIKWAQITQQSQWTSGTPPYHQTMEPYSTSHTYSKTSCYRPPKRNWRDCT